MVKKHFVSFTYYYNAEYEPQNPPDWQILHFFWQVRILIALHPIQFHSVITLVTKNETECAILIRNLTTGMLYVM